MMTTVLLVVAVWAVAALVVVELMFARAVLEIVKDKTMSEGCAWVHYLCPECFPKRPPGREPFKLQDQEFLPCCDCGKVTIDGTWYRPPGSWQHYPTDFRCAEDVSVT